MRIPFPVLMILAYATCFSSAQAQTRNTPITPCPLLLFAESAPTQSAPPQRAPACVEAQKLYEQKRYAEAEARLTAAIGELEGTSQSATPRGICLTQLAATQNKEGKYLPAEAAARQAMAIFEPMPFEPLPYSGRLPVLSFALGALSDALEGQGKYSDAAKVVERQWTLEGKNDADPTDAYRGIPFRRHLGRLYSENGEYDRAVALLQKNVALLERPRLNVPTSVVPALNDLAQAYIAQGKFTDGEVALHRALTLIDRYPEQIDDPLLLITLDIYASLLKQTSRTAEAEQVAKRANSVRARNGGTAAP
jgi:tetratricopeptide (TPR) repeat protein